MACGGWLAGEWKLATWRRPNARDVHPQWHSGTAHEPLGPPVPRRARGTHTAIGVARVRNVTRGCALAFPGENSSLRLTSNWFFSKFSN
jgi:hypothetical protein